MSYTWKENLVSSSKYNIKCPYSMTPKYVVVHDTANSAPAKNEISYMISNGNEVSFHVAVDEKEAIQGIPFNRNSWSCGDGGKGQGNRYGISVEICRPTNSDRTLYDKSEENAVYVCARLLYKFGLGINNLKQHHDFASNGKNCPAVIRNEGRWESFKSRVNSVLVAIKNGTCEASLESGTSSIKSKVEVEKVSVINGEWKVKVLVETNLWLDTQYKQGKGTVKKGQVLYVTQMTKDGLFFVVDGKYLSNNHKLNYVCDMWKKPLGKIQLKQDCNAWSYCNYDVVVNHVKAWEVFEYSQKRNDMYEIPYLGWVSAAFVNKELKLTDALVTNRGE